MAIQIPQAHGIAYEDRLDRDRRWALDQGGLHFEGKSAVQKTLRSICRRLDELEIPYAVVGGMALFEYGVRRFTEAVDLLVTEEGLRQLHERLEGRGYVAPFSGSKQLRDTDSGVRVEFLVSGRFPGDGKPKSVVFPDPDTEHVERDGIKYIPLARLVELKLASGMTGGVHRLKDLTDVVALIETLKLSTDFVEQLDPFVRQKYLELWKGAQEAPPEP
jgi:hypothetical protein